MKMPGPIKSFIRINSGLHARLYRLLGGNGFFNKNTLILTTKGRKSGRAIATPLLYVTEGERVFLVASFGGSDHPPGWYLNLTANPEVSAEIGDRTRLYRARSLPTEEAQPVWPKLLAIWPAYASYQKRTTRVIPIVELKPI